MNRLTSPFLSHRERRLWIWAGLVAAGILISLTFARSLADALRDRGALDAAFGVAFLLAIAGVVVLGLRRRTRTLQIGVALVVAAAYALTFIRMGIPEERTHLIEYGILAVLVYEAFLERRRHGPKPRGPALVAVAATALLGWLDEGIQWLLPERVYDWRDVAFNVLAALMAILASVALRRAGRRPSAL